MEEKQRIVVAHEEPQLTRVLRRSLTTHGYDVRVAGDGEFALQTFRDWPAALVITDLAKTNKSGLCLCFRGGDKKARNGKRVTPATTITSQSGLAWRSWWHAFALRCGGRPLRM